MATTRVAYLINQYPKVSHSFIRREILALERLGVAVQRFALRGWDDTSPDPQDQAELKKTRYVLQSGVKPLLKDGLRVAVKSPRRFARALAQAWAMSKSSGGHLPYHLAYLLEACRVLRWCEELGIEHLHAHFGTNPAEVAMYCRMLGGPRYSFTVHGPEEFDKPESLALKDKIEHSQAVVAISSFGRSQIYRWIRPGQWPKVAVVHCGLEDAFHHNPPALAAKPGQLVCVGRLCEQKGQVLLVEAARMVADRGLDFHIVLAGDGEMRPQVEATIARLNLQSRFTITGWINGDQVRQHILTSQALVLPSFAEGLPVVLMEAMALRRPVLTTYVAGIPELVQHGHSGWLFPAGDILALADALHACLSADRATLGAMGDAAHAQATQRHNIDVEAGKLRQLFDQRERVAA
jgi:colanic acid/amylovoran biosynthesis glycosyltransferase